MINYKIVTNFSRNKQRGGSCVLVKKGIMCRELSCLKQFALEKSFECCGIEITENNLIIICIYRTPTSDPYIFLNKLESVLENIFKKYKYKVNVIVTGDFNINTLKTTKVTEHLTDIVNNFNLNFHINVPTRKKACIDHILSNFKDATANVLPLHLSDHETAQLLSVPIKVKTIKAPSFYIYRRDYSNENIEKFKVCLGQLSWTEVYAESNFNIAFDTFYDTICMFYKLCFPKIRIKVNKTNKNKQNWFSLGLKTSCKRKRYLRYKYYKNKSAINKNRYKEYSKILKKCIVNLKKNANMKFINRSNNKCKAAWTLIKNETCDVKYDHNVDSIKIDNKILTDPVEIAEAFNSYFIESIQAQTNNNVNHNVTRELHKTANSMFLAPMLEDEVKKEVLSLNNTNSVGCDEICTTVIKTSIDIILSVLTYLINFSFSSATFPDALKVSIIKPLYKKGPKSDINNYRPITLIPIFAKVFEKCVYKRLMAFCDKYEIITNDQYGFRKKKSTSLAICNLLRTTLTSLNRGDFTTALFFDLSKAFDHVSHDILLKKLELIGVRGVALNYMASYLRDRKQYVIVTKLNSNNEVISYSSDLKSNICGVPQGSILGPILFLLYINDITRVSDHKCVLFADDISIIVTSNKKENTTAQHENDINKTVTNIVNWLDINKLKVNMTKTYYIKFNNFLNYKLNISYNNSAIEEVNQTQFLGLIIDRDLNYKTQVEHICARINKFVYALRQVRQLTNMNTALSAYHAYIGSILRYGIIAWGNSTNVNRAFIAQKRCIRAMCGIPSYVSCRTRFRGLGLLTLPSLYIYEICVYVKQCPQSFKKACEVYPRNRRNPDRLVHEEKPKTRLYDKSFLTMCIKIYNRISDDIRQSNIRLFKTKLYRWLMEHEFYSIQEFFDITK